MNLCKEQRFQIEPFYKWAFQKNGDLNRDFWAIASNPLAINCSKLKDFFIGLVTCIPINVPIVALFPIRQIQFVWNCAKDKRCLSLAEKKSLLLNTIVKELNELKFPYKGKQRKMQYDPFQAKEEFDGHCSLDFKYRDQTEL